MKFFKIIAFGWIGLVCFQSCSDTQVKETAKVNEVEEVVEKEAVIADASVTMKIDGMVCSKGCVSAIQNGLAAMPGIGNCVVDYENKTATITYDSKQVSSEEMPSKLATIYDGQYVGVVVDEAAESVQEEVVEVEV